MVFSKSHILKTGFCDIRDTKDINSSDGILPVKGTMEGVLRSLMQRFFDKSHIEARNEPNDNNIFVNVILIWLCDLRDTKGIIPSSKATTRTYLKWSGPV